MRVIYRERGRDPLYKIWNSSPDNMIILFHSDGGSLVLRDGIYSIERGGICFIGAGRQNYTMPEDIKLYDRSKIFLSDTELRGLLGVLGDSSRVRSVFGQSSFVYAKLSEDELTLADSLFRESHEGGADETVHAFLSLLILMSRRAERSVKTPDNCVTRVLKYINGFYTENISLEDAAQAASLSKSHLCRRFKAAVGMTVSEYILLTRIAAAKDLLISTDLPLGVVSDRCGFSSQAYFCQAFRSAVGCSPLKYKKEHIYSRNSK